MNMSRLRAPITANLQTGTSCQPPDWHRDQPGVRQRKNKHDKAASLQTGTETRPESDSTKARMMKLPASRLAQRPARSPNSQHVKPDGLQTGAKASPESKQASCQHEQGLMASGLAQSQPRVQTGTPNNPQCAPCRCRRWQAQGVVQGLGARGSGLRGSGARLTGPNPKLSTESPETVNLI